MFIEIGKYLNQRLLELGVQHIFGMPGDYNLSYLEQVEKNEKLNFIGNCNELNAAYAADGYARSNGFSALVTAYGVGDLSAINGIAGAYAHNVPIVHLSGIPPLHIVNKRIISHHTLLDGNYENVMNCMKEFTVAQTRLTPANAALEIDRVLRQCIIERRPVYIQIPSDITHIKIRVNPEPLNLNLPLSDPELLDIATEQICKALSKANRPAFLIDEAAKIFGVSPILTQIAIHHNIPYACLCSAKNVMDESLPQYAGTYMGHLSQPETRKIIEQSDCLIGVGVRLSDASTCLFTHQLPKENFIEISQHDLSIENRNFPGVGMTQLFEKLQHRLKLSPTAPFKLEKSKAKFEKIIEDESLSQAVLWKYIERFFKPHDVIIAEIGTSSSALAAMQLPATADFISQTQWGAIGFTLPAMLGSLLAQPERRHILFIGDGAIQLTVQELSTIIRHKLKPIIFVVNNGGYTIERLILGENSSYNNIQNWKYTEIVPVFNEGEQYRSVVVETEGQLSEALNMAADTNSLTLIELKLPMMDASVNLRKFGDMTAQHDFGDFGYKKLQSNQGSKKDLCNFAQPFNYSSLVEMKERQLHSKKPSFHFPEN